MAILSRLPSNSSSPKPLFQLEYEIETLDVLFAFELQMGSELEGQQIVYDTELAVGPESYSLTYYIYASPEQTDE